MDDLADFLVMWLMIVLFIAFVALVAGVVYLAFTWSLVAGGVVSFLIVTAWFAWLAEFA